MRWWVIPEGHVHWFWTSSVPLLFPQSVSWESWYPGSWFSSFLLPPHRNTLLCLTSRLTDRSWLYPFTCSLSKETILANWWPPAEKQSQPISTGLRNSTLCFSTSGVKPFACPLTPFRASSFLTCWRKTAHLSGQAHDRGIRQLWVVFLTLWVQASYFISEAEFLHL